MPHIVQSATGEMIDLDMLKIKAALAENVINLEIKKNSAFIEDPEKTAIVNNINKE